MVETRAPGTEQISHRILTRTKRRKMAFFEGCPVCGGGGVFTGAGLVDGGVDQGPWLQERVGGGVGFQRRGRVGKGFGCGGVGGRGTGPRDGANFATCVTYKKKKNGFF